MARKIDPEKRAAILKASRKLFRENGVHNTSMAEIASKAGIANGTVYLYFGSKLDIVRALCDYYYLSQMKAVRPYLENHDIKKAISGSVHAALDHASKNADLIHLVDVQRSHGGRAERAQSDMEAERTFTVWIQQKIDSGLFSNCDPAALAEMVGAMVHWVSRRCFVWADAERSRYENTLIEMITTTSLKDAGHKDRN